MDTMTVDNRQTPRILTSVPCSYGLNENATRNGTITSLSTNGCFVKTKAVAATGQTIFLVFCLPDEQRLSIKIAVIYHIDDIGFGAIFTQIKAADQSAVDDFLEHSLSSK